MKCHYTYFEGVGKVIIPGCWQVVMSNDMSQCSCVPTESFKQFERKQYNEVLNQKNQEIKELESEIIRLNRILKRINK